MIKRRTLLGLGLTAAALGVGGGAVWADYAAALHFAARHPDRCRSLTLLVPAAGVAGDAAQGALPALDATTMAIIEYTLKSDFIFWLGITLARDRKIRSLLATNPALVAAASPEERERVHAILWNILLVSEQAQGLLNDTRFVTARQSIALEQIRAPTLAISLEDDFYGTIAPARIIAAKIPGARLVTYAAGGHVWVGHDAEVFAEIDRFIRKN